MQRWYGVSLDVDEEHVAANTEANMAPQFGVSPGYSKVGYLRFADRKAGLIYSRCIFFCKA